MLEGLFKTLKGEGDNMTLIKELMQMSGLSLTTLMWISKTANVSGSELDKSLARRQAERSREGQMALADVEAILVQSISSKKLHFTDEAGNVEDVKAVNALDLIIDNVINNVITRSAKTTKTDKPEASVE